MKRCLTPENPSKFLIRMHGAKPQLSQPDSQFFPQNNIQEKETRLGNWIRNFIDTHSLSTKLQKSTTVPLHLQTLGTREETYSQISHRDPSFLSTLQIGFILIHLIHISHSKHGSVWGNRPQLPIITHLLAPLAPPLWGGLQLPMIRVSRKWCLASKVIETTFDRSCLFKAHVEVMCTSLLLLVLAL